MSDDEVRAKLAQIELEITALEEAWSSGPKATPGRGRLAATLFDEEALSGRRGERDEVTFTITVKPYYGVPRTRRGGLR